MRSTLISAALVFTVVGLASRADATPITYELSAIASGQIGGTAFSNALVEFTGTGDTANIVSLLLGGPYANAFSTLTVSIGGVGTATITDPSEIIGLPFPIIDPDGQIPPIPLVIFGRTDNPPDLSGITGMGGGGGNVLAGYDLTAIGPITIAGGIGFSPLCGTPGHDPCLQTTLGALSFTTNDVFADQNQATFAATLEPEPVPEPTTGLLVSGGLAALVRRARRRKRS